MPHWILILILIGKMAGSANTVTTIEFSSQESCLIAQARVDEWNRAAEERYPTDTPHLHGLCVPK